MNESFPLCVPDPMNIWTKLLRDDHDKGQELVIKQIIYM